MDFTTHNIFRCTAAPSLSWLLLLLLWAAPILVQAQAQLWGLTSKGGVGAGAIVKIKTGGSDFQAIPLPFDTAGAYPYGELLQASNGRFYGMTTQGGNSNVGVLFEYTPAGGGYAVKHHFDDATGDTPYGSLIESGGRFYGMTTYGGSNDAGVLFEYDPSGSGSYVVKHHFVSSTGRLPFGSLIESGGRFYGMTAQGGNGNVGVLFEYDPSGSGSYVVKHHFDGTNGGNPNGSLIESGGRFYGMTAYGGSNDAGVLFEYDPSGSGSYVVKHYFVLSTGLRPLGSLIEWGGRFYGMTAYGGSNDAGVLFEYDPSGSGSYAVKHHFMSSTGRYPRGSLIESGGRFYGMTVDGGGSNVARGVLFEYDPSGSGSYAVKHHFQYATGQQPYGSLIESGGRFYGMTSAGGIGRSGVLFEYAPSGSGSYAVKVNFNATSIGSSPQGSLIESGGRFYGMTSGGGNNNTGVLFEYNPSGSGSYEAKHHFDHPTGGNARGSLIKSGGRFYGMALGGSNNAGVLFEYDPSGSGSYVVKHHFDGANGSAPYGSLIKWGGRFYGMTVQGGINNAGVLFEYDPSGSGSYVVKHYFDGTNGRAPYGSLIESGGRFYGMTVAGGNSGYGVLFEYDPSGSGSYVVKHHFDGSTGRLPYGSLIESGGRFYGMTQQGGSNNAGVLFEYDPSGSGSYVVKHHFVISTGGYPLGSLVESGGRFYGMTYQGGSNNGGVLFEYNPSGSGSYAVLKNLGGSDGANPQFGHLIVVGECTPVTYYRDLDGDGFGNSAVTQMACTPPTGYVANNTDCNDNNAAINPAATEVCDGIDNNCNGQADEPQAIGGAWSSNDVGAGVNGSANTGCSGGSGVYNVSATGFSTSGSDQLHLLSQQLCGNGEIIAHVLNVGSGGWAGITFRESLMPGSKKVTLKTQLSVNIRREIRLMDNAATSSLNFSRPGHTWLCLARNGSTFTAYTSTNGSAWTFAFSTTISMTGCIFAGIFAESINGTTVTDAQFDHVVITALLPLSGPHAGITQTLDGLSVSVYPNPGKGEMTLAVSGAPDVALRLEVQDVLGRMVRNIELREGTNFSYPLDLSSEPSGIYYLRLRMEDGMENVQRIVLQR